MKNIIVPVDFSADSVRAFEKAVSMAKRLEAEINLIYVNKTRSFMGFFGGGTPTEAVPDIEKGFQDLLKGTNRGTVKISYHIKNGKVSKEIAKFAEENNAYIIVMGTHGASGFDQSWAGSNAYRVVTAAPCPVLTLRGEDKHMDIRKIVLPIDLNASTRQKVPFTMELAKAFRAEIHVVATCLDDSDEFVMKLTSYAGQVSRFLTKYNVKNVNEFLKGSNPTDMTIEYAQKVNADLISIMTEQESSFMNTFIGPYAQQMVNRSPIPVLSMHRNLSLEGDVHIM